MELGETQNDETTGQENKRQESCGKDGAIYIFADCPCSLPQVAEYQSETDVQAKSR